MKQFNGLALALGLCLLAPSLASAKGALVSTDPAIGSTVAKVSAITLRFDGPVTAASAGADVTMTGMPGMTDHPPMLIKAFTIEPGATPDSIVLKLKKPLVPGTYEVGYSVVVAGQRLDGTVPFTVGS
ncbi:MAG: copper resistance protein CopC [Hyphomonadaceae bacterium]|nr:copper resistance protein CopC [Hyphomonadaceae bacterium]